MWFNMELTQSTSLKEKLNKLDDLLNTIINLKGSPMKQLFSLFLMLFTVSLSFTVSSQQKDYGKNEMSNRIFDKILDVTKNLQFEGTAYHGQFDGDCFMVLRNGKKINDDYEKILFLRYALLNWIQPKLDILEETFTVNDLKIYSRDTSDIGLRNPDNYANLYIKGNFKALKASMNNGPIENGSGGGTVIFAIDSIGKKFRYAMVGGTGNYSFEGYIELEEKNHIQIKKIFRDSISPVEERRIMASYLKKVKITSK